MQFVAIGIGLALAKTVLTATTRKNAITSTTTCNDLPTIVFQTTGILVKNVLIGAVMGLVWPVTLVVVVNDLYDTGGVLVNDYFY